MRVIDCYYIKGYGNNSTCKKIHGVGLGYNVAASAVYIKGVTIVAGVLAIHPIVVCLGYGVAQGFVKGAIQYVKGGM